MRPYLVGGSCHRVQKQLDAALSEGVLEFPPELAAHADRCPHCLPQVRETEGLFRRLRSAPASLDLGPVPGVVDSVLQHIATEQPFPVTPPPPHTQAPPHIQAPDRRRKPRLRWLLGQAAALAAVFCIAVGGITYLALRVNHAVGGAEPSEVVERWVAPLHNWTQALFRNAR